MKRKREDFPECPVINPSSLKFESGLILQIRRTIGCIHALFQELQSPPKMIEGPTHTRDDVGDIMEIKYKNATPVPIDMDQWHEMRNKYVNRLGSISNVTQTFHYDSGNYYLVFTIAVAETKIERKIDDFPECPVIDTSSLKFESDLILQIRRTIGCIHVLFKELQSPPKIVEGPTHTQDDSGDIVEIKYENATPVPVDMDHWHDLREKNVKKLVSISNVTQTFYYDSGNHYLVFTIAVVKT